MRALLLALALVVGLGSTDAHAKDAVLVKLRDDAPAPRAAAKPAPTKKSTTRASKRKPPARKTVAKSKPKPKKKSSSSKSKSEPTRLRPMP